MNNTERFQKVRSILYKNDLVNCSRNHEIFDKLSNEDLDNKIKIDETIKIITELEERIKNSSNKYPEHIMRVLRQRSGLDEFDTSKDIILSEMEPCAVFSEVCNWNGLINYDSTIKGWIKDIYGVELRFEEV